MTLEHSRYDPEVQRSTDGLREPRWAYLRFLRWLAECGRLEHDPVGPPAGDDVNEGSEHPRPDRTNAPSAAVLRARSA